MKIHFQDIKDVMQLPEYSPEENDWIILASKKFKDYYRENSAIAGGLPPFIDLCSLRFPESKNKQ